MKYIISIFAFQRANGLFSGGFFKDFLSDLDFGPGTENIMDMLFNPEQFTEGFVFDYFKS